MRPQLTFVPCAFPPDTQGLLVDLASLGIKTLEMLSLDKTHMVKFRKICDIWVRLGTQLICWVQDMTHDTEDFAVQVH